MDGAMIPMPPELREQWRALWAFDHHPERPWWKYAGPYGTNPETGKFQDGFHYDRATGPGLWVPAHRITASLAAYDAKHPIPAPPPLPGQVWAFPYGEAQITAVERAMSYARHERPEDAKLRLCPVWSTPLIRLNRQWHVTEAECQESQWPIRGAILVAGPSCYGFNMPWCPVEGK